MQQPSIDRIAAVFDRNATRYDRQIGAFERFMLGNARGWAVGHAKGRVLELAVGTGLNLPRYGGEVEQVIGVDISQGVLDIAEQRPHRPNLAVQLRLGDVQDLDVRDASVDTVVSTYSFCTIPDPGRACAQAYRALIPGGVFVLAEQGPSTSALARLLMRVAEPISVRFGADHLLRDPIPYLEAAGFVITESRRSGCGGIAFRVLAHKPVERVDAHHR